MADVFISYARADKARVAPLVAAIEAQPLRGAMRRVADTSALRRLRLRLEPAYARAPV